MTYWIWTPTFFIAIGGALSLVGTIWAAREQSISERQSRLRAETTIAHLEGSNEFELGNSFSVIETLDVIHLFIRNTGRFPAYGVTFRAIDVDAYGHEEIQDMIDIQQQPSPIYEKALGDISPGAIAQGLSLKLNRNSREANFRIFLVSRKGSSTIRAKYSKSNTGIWTQEILEHDVH